MDAKYNAILTQSPLFRGLTSKQVAAFVDAAHTVIKDYKKNNFIALTGEPMEGIGVVLEGRAHLTRENTLGQRAIVTDLTESQMFGEALLFTDKPSWPATIQTAMPTKVLFLPASAFTELVPGCEPYQTQLLINLLHDMSEKALLLTRKVHYLTLKGMREKIFAYLIDIYKKQATPNLTLPHNRQEMADVLNVSRTAMSRELSRLAAEGIITVKGRQVTLLRIHEIEEYQF